MNQMMQQKNAGGANQPNPGANGGAPGQLPQLPQQQPQKPPRAVGTPLQEAKYMADDVTQGVLNLLPDFLQDIFHVKPTDTPQDAAKKRQMLQNYNKLNSEQQQVVQKQFQEEQMKKRKEEEERIRKKQEEQQKAAQSQVSAPVGKKQGAGAGQAGMSKKQSTIDTLNQKRKQLSSAD